MGSTQGVKLNNSPRTKNIGITVSKEPLLSAASMRPCSVVFAAVLLPGASALPAPGALPSAPVTPAAPALVSVRRAVWSCGG